MILVISGPMCSRLIAKLALAKHLEPTWEALCAEALAEDVLHVDETGWRMMGSKTNPKWALFGLTSPRVAVREWAFSQGGLKRISFGDPQILSDTPRILYTPVSGLLNGSS